MSLRERVLIALGAIAVAGTVIIPVAYRLDTEVLQADADPSARRGPTPPLPATPFQATLEPAVPATAEPSISTAPSRSSSPAPHIVVAWAAEASAHRNEIGGTFSYDCPPNGPLGLIWGTGIYTDDSPVCTAAVHDGRITLETGGTVSIVMRPGRASYEGSLANGVLSDPYPGWPGSYEFLPTSDTP